MYYGAIVTLLAQLIVIFFLVWIMSKLFSLTRVVVTYPIGKIKNKLFSSSPQYQTTKSYKCLSEFSNYYLLCVWPALMVTWFVNQNMPLSWINYTVATCGFFIGRVTNYVTAVMFFIFCCEPEVVNFFYGWIPLEKIYMSVIQIVTTRTLPSW